MVRLMYINLSLILNVGRELVDILKNFIIS